MRQTLKLGVLFGLFLCLCVSAWADLILYYDFEVPADPNFVLDKSSYNNDGFLVADTESGSPAVPLPGPTSDPNWIDGVYGGGMQFSSHETNPNNYNSVWIPKSDSLTDLGGKWTICLWLRQDSRMTTPGGGGGYPRVISCANYEVELGVPSWEYDYFWPYVNPQWQVDLGTSYIGGGGSLGQWYHMAYVYDGTNLVKYINGTLVPNSVKNIPNQLIHDEWSTGGWVDSYLKLACQTWPYKDWFIGAMDDVAIWSYGYLDAAAIQGLYNGTYTPLTVPVIEEIRKLPEEIPASFLFNTTFINEYNGGIILGAGPDGFLSPHTPWNWNIADNSGVEFAYGIQNVSLWDGGEPNVVRYAGYVTTGVPGSQSLGRRLVAYPGRDSL
jgi:hypothetical protein